MPDLFEYLHEKIDGQHVDDPKLIPKYHRLTDGLPHLRAGDGPGERHLRVYEAWLREFPAHAGRPMTNRTVNEAVAWWNAGAPTSPGGRASG